MDTNTQTYTCQLTSCKRQLLSNQHFNRNKTKIEHYLKLNVKKIKMCDLIFQNCYKKRKYKKEEDKKEHSEMTENNEKTPTPAVTMTPPQPNGNGDEIIP